MMNWSTQYKSCNDCVVFYRQHSWDWNQEKWLQQKAARAVLSSSGNRRQQLPCSEQHKHNDYPCLQMWFWWYHPVLQCGSNLLTSRPQHRSTDCNLVVYCYTFRLVLWMWMWMWMWNTLIIHLWINLCCFELHLLLKREAIENVWQLMATFMLLYY